MSPSIPPTDASETIATGVVALLRSLLSSLQPAERRVADYVLDHPEDVTLASVNDVAAAAGTSSATVVRLCQSIGLRGFQHLKIALAHDLAPRRELRISQLSPASTHAAILEGVATAARDGLLSIADTVDPAAFTRAVDLLAAARRVLAVGIGSSSAVAQDFVYRLATVGGDVEGPVDAHLQELRAHLLGPRDVLLAVSASGSTRETVETTRVAAATGASTIAVTSFRRSPLAEVADVALVAGGPQLLAIRTESMTSRLVHLAVLDALVVALALGAGDRSGPALDAVDDVASRHRV
jgi:DNA-binding MurR/RpiR family transcriptional regulator